MGAGAGLVGIKLLDLLVALLNPARFKLIVAKESVPCLKGSWRLLEKLVDFKLRDITTDY